MASRENTNVPTTQSGRDVDDAYYETLKIDDTHWKKSTDEGHRESGCKRPPWWGIVLFFFGTLILIAIIAATIIITADKAPSKPLTGTSLPNTTPSKPLTGTSLPNTEEEFISSCSEAPMSGIYTLRILDHNVKVYCQIDTTGKWTVFQRRVDGSVNFYRKWASYKSGFGDLAGEFWLGNDIIHQLTSLGDQKLRVDLEDWNGTKYTIEYGVFQVADEESRYKVRFEDYMGTIPPGDSLASHNGLNFVTYDVMDAAKKCSVNYGGGWWYGDCHTANPNGWYNKTTFAKGLNWTTWKGYYYSLKYITLMASKKVDPY